ncbi:MAG: urease accessory protein UreD [Pseudomonadota bacterium]|nr:urease accessory protein UreD [Pseudomonadota bacterium]
MGWHGHLQLNYRLAAERTVLHDRHEGPLRVLRSLYPEGPAVCHNVLVHPPGGIAGGEVLDVDVAVAPGAHALVTTAGATRFYRTSGEVATQALTARVEAGARLEWLPLETIAFSGCRAENSVRFELAAGAEAIGWDVLALGLPASDQPFERGRYTQSIELPGRWLERGAIDAADHRLLASPLGFDGRRAIGTLWFAAGVPIEATRRDALLEAARAVIGIDALSRTAGATAPQPQVVVVRALAPSVEPLLDLLTHVWRKWRPEAWGLAATPPRVWRT